MLLGEGVWVGELNHIIWLLQKCLGQASTDQPNLLLSHFVSWRIFTNTRKKCLCVRNFPWYDRREVCTSHHHEQWRYKPGFNDHHLQHSSGWNSQWNPWQTSSEEKICGLLQKFLICVTDGENWERNDLNLKDLRNTGKWTTSRRCMKKAKENWIGEQCRETEKNLRKNNSKRAYQLVKDLTTVKQGKGTTVQDCSRKCLTKEWEILNRQNTALSCTISRPMGIHQQDWTVPRQTQKMTTPSFAEKCRLQ